MKEFTHENPIISPFNALSVSAQDYIVIRDSPDGGGNEVADVSMTTDDSLTLYTAGYDSSDNYIGNQIVEWSSTGTLNWFNVTDSVFVFKPTMAPTTGTISATVGNMSDATGTITVVGVGELCYIKIQCSPGPQAIDNSENVCYPEYEDTLMANVGDYMNIFFVGYDCHGNYLSLISVDLDSTDIDFTGTLKVESWNNWTFTEPGQGRIIVKDIDTSGVIVVQEPNTRAPEYIQIRTAPYGGGLEVMTFVMTSDDSQTFYAARYDSSDNFIRNQIVEWSTTGDLDPVNTIDTALVFRHTSSSAMGTIIATAGSLSDTTGLITVLSCGLSHIVIRDAPDGGGSEVTTLTMTTDESITFYAAAYDAEDNFIGNQTADWALTGSLDSYGATDTAFIFSPNTAPTTGSIIATVDDMSDATGTITVNVGALCYIKIRGTPCSVIILPPPSDNVCFPDYDDTTTAYVGDRMTFWAGAYDCEGNYRGDVHVDSWAIELTGTLKMENATFIDVGQGRIILNGTDTSGVIIVTDNPASIAKNNTVQTQFKLEQAYPNPFNPSTTIHFYLPKAEHVKLEVYNNIGQIVETLIDWQMTAGEHKVEFNAMHLSSGVYYYRLVTANFTDVKKIILMK